jgi:hypothetical protein
VGINRFELPAIHPEESGEGVPTSSEATAERDVSTELAALGRARDPAQACAFTADLDAPFDDGASDTRATSTLVRLDGPLELDAPNGAAPAPAGSPPRLGSEEDDFSDFDDPAHPPSRAAAPAEPSGPSAPSAPPVIHLSPRAIVVSTLGPAELRKLPLDPQIMFVLTQFDGVTDLDTVLEMTGVPADAALDALDDLAQRGVIVRIA